MGRKKEISDSVILEKSEKIKKHFYKLREKDEIFFRKDAQKKFELSRYEIRCCVEYLREDKVFKDAYDDNTKKRCNQVLRSNEEIGGKFIRKTKRRNEIVSIFKEKSKDMSNVDDLHDILKEKGYKAEINTLRWDLTELRNNNYTLKFGGPNPRLGETLSTDVEERMRKVENIIKEAGYVPQPVLAEFLDCSKIQIKHIIKKFETTNDGLHRKYVNLQRRKQYEIRSEIKKFKGDLVLVKFTMSL